VLLAAAASCTEVVEIDPPGPEAAAVGSDPARDAGSTLAPSVPVVDGDPGLPVRTRDGLLSGTTVPPRRSAACDFYRRVIGEQLALYPPALLKSVGLKQVVLCERLSFDGTECLSFADVERGRLYVSLGAGLNADYLTRSVHHEVFHQIDYADDQTLDTDPRWESLNPPGFRYTQDADRLQADPDATRPDDGLTGFLNRYSTSSPAEDKAELFSYLVVDPGGVRRRAARDAIIRRKVDRLRAMLDGFGPYGRALIGP
jgi:hypothetical protein